MFQSFICGSSKHQEEEDDDEVLSSPGSTPRKSRKYRLCKSQNKENKNPYSNRGLDKFSALLAELEEKRQKIYSQAGSQDISFVRFRYNNSTDCVPIVVKIKDKGKEETKKKVPVELHSAAAKIDSEQVLDKRQIETMVERKEETEEISKLSKLQSISEKTEKKNKKKSSSWNVHRWRRPSYYLPAFLILILFLLVFFGRPVSILYTCIGWYIIPALQREKRLKKDHVRKHGESLLASEGYSSPRSNKSEAIRYKSSRVHDLHR